MTTAKRNIELRRAKAFLFLAADESKSPVERENAFKIFWSIKQQCEIRLIELQGVELATRLWPPQKHTESAKTLKHRRLNWL